MPPAPYRFYVRSADGQRIFGVAHAESAEAAALEFGDGAHVIDTLAKNYEPMLQEVMGGALVIAGVSGWDTGKAGGLDRDLMQAVKHGRTAIVHAFLEKGADANARDAGGGAALHWAAARGDSGTVSLLLAHGADQSACDAKGLTPAEVARNRGKTDVAAMLEAP